MMGPSTLFAVRDAIIAHLGEAKARDLGIEVQTSTLRDIIEVRTPSASFVITHRAFLADDWQAELGRQLDALAANAADAAPAPSQARQDSPKQAATGQDSPKQLPSPNAP